MRGKTAVFFARTLGLVILARTLGVLVLAGNLGLVVLARSWDTYVLALFTGLTAAAADRGDLGQQTYHPEWMSAWMHGCMNGLVHGIEGRLMDG